MVSHETEPLLEARHVTKRYGSSAGVVGLSLRVQQGEIVSLLGPSGSGKSTLLRCIAGLERLDDGQIVLASQDITGLPAHRRGFGMMFQQFALFPHRTVAQNVAFGLRMQGVARPERDARVAAMLDLVGLRGYGQRTIFELSGGEQQRVALARSLAPRPPLLMLDEPLGSLDRALRERLVDDLRRILKDVGMTALYVTHDQQEAFAISDRLVLLHQGQKVQEGTAEAVYRHPASRFAAEFFGLRNHLAVEGVGSQGAANRWQVQTALGAFEVETEAAPTGWLLLRPDAARLRPRQGDNVVAGVLVERSFRGTHYRVTTRHQNGAEFEWELALQREALPKQGEAVTLGLRPDALTFVAD